MDRQHRTRLVGHGSHLAQERHEVRAQRLGRDILVTVQLPLELLQRETLLRAGRPAIMLRVISSFSAASIRPKRASAAARSASE